MTAVPRTAQDLTAAFDMADVEMFSVTLPGAVVLTATKAALRRFKCDAADILGKPLVKFGTGALSARYVETAGSEDQKIEIAYAQPLGGTVLGLFKAMPWRDDEGQLMVLIGQHRNDVEAAAYQQSEQRLQLALRSGGYAAWDYDYQTGKTFVSPELNDLLGLPRYSHELDYQGFNELIHPVDVDKTLDEQIRKAPFDADIFHTKYRVRSAAGDYLWIESVAGIVRDPATGRPGKAVGICRDISDQTYALEKIRMSERNLKRSQSAARLGSFTVRPDHNSSRLSSEMVALLELDDNVMPPSIAMFESMMDNADRDQFRAAIDAAMQGQETSGLEVAVRCKSGDAEYFDCSIEPEFDSHGNIECVFGTCQCITERKLLERKFIQAQKMEAVGQLTGGVAHDFNNLMMVVLGNLQLVERMALGNHEMLKRVRAAIEATNKGSELTKRLLAFARQQTLQNVEFPVNAQIVKMHQILRQAAGTDVEIRLEAQADTDSIKTDPSMLESALLNLTINARDAMATKGGVITIATKSVTVSASDSEGSDDMRPGNYVEIAVTDTGCGIPPENLDKVFTPFFTTKAPEAGSGLGLSMIYGFAKQTGGHVRIESQVGHGTTVRLRLPHAPAEPQVIAPVAPESPEPMGSTVLVIEDNEAVREIAAAMIRDMGLATVEAANGAEGLRIIQHRDDIGLVLSDVIMAGGMSGPELAAKALKLRPNLRVLFMSGYTAGITGHAGFAEDAFDLVNKPFTRTDLTEKVRRALAA